MPLLDKTKGFQESSDRSWNAYSKKILGCEEEVFFIYMRIIAYSLTFLFLGFSITFHPFHLFSEDILHAERITSGLNIAAMSVLFGIMIFDLFKRCGRCKRVIIYSIIFVSLSMLVYYYSTVSLFSYHIATNPRGVLTAEFFIFGSYVIAVGILLISITLDLISSEGKVCPIKTS